MILRFLLIRKLSSDIIVQLFKEIFPHFSAPDELLKSEVLMSKKLSNYMLGNVNTYENIAICINS